MKWLRVLSPVVVAFALVSLTASNAMADGEKKKREEISQADGERLLAFFSKFVDAIVKNKDNCANMAKEVTAVIDANADAVKLASDAKAADKKLPKPLEEKMMARVKEMMPAMQKCGGDKDVKEAIKKMDKKPDPQKAANK